MRHRLSASRRGEDRREPHLRPVQPLRGPHGLRRGRLQWVGLLPGRGEGSQRGSAAPRAQAVRVILTELNRIASHLLWLGTHALDIGAITPVFYCLREREEALKIFEKYCGARLTTHAFRIGGLLYETYDGFEQDIRDFCAMFLPKVDEYEELLTNNRIWKGRLVDVGILSANECKEYGVTGPVLRAAGVKWDLRKAQPYSGYEKYDFDIPTRETGDLYDRYMIRMEEMRQSVRIMRQAVEAIPEGPIMGKVGKVIKPAVGEAYTSSKRPRASWDITSSAMAPRSPIVCACGHPLL